MTTEFMDGMFAVDPRPPAWLESFEKASADPIIKAFGDYGQRRRSRCRPSRRWRNVFGDAGLAEYKVANGADPTTTMEKAADSINKANANIG